MESLISIEIFWVNILGAIMEAPLGLTKVCVTAASLVTGVQFLLLTLICCVWDVVIEKYNMTNLW